MGAFFDGIKRAAKAATGNLPGRYAVANRPVICPHCQGEQFLEGRALLNTAGMTLLNLDWAQKSAYVLTCADCSRIEWYADHPLRPSEQT